MVARVSTTSSFEVTRVDSLVTMVLASQRIVAVMATRRSDLRDAAYV